MELFDLIDEVTELTDNFVATISFYNQLTRTYANKVRNIEITV